MSTVERVLSLLQLKNITASRLSLDLGFSNTLISDWKKGKAKPSTDALMKIAVYFDVSVDYLLGLTDVPDRLYLGHAPPSPTEAEPLRADVQRILNLINNLPPSEIAHIEGYILGRLEKINQFEQKKA